MISPTKNRLHRSCKRLLLSVTAALIIIGGVAFWWWQSRSSSDVGQLVASPRTIEIEGSSTAEATPQTEAMLMLTPEVLSRAGLKIDAVEKLATPEGNRGIATGVVEPNAYRTAPVISLVSGVLRSVNVELGDHAKRGQAVATVFSDELANAQSRYLAARAELDEHHKHHRRAEQLVEIGAISREEFEQAITKIRTAEAEEEASRQRLLFLGFPPQLVKSLRSSTQITSEVNLIAPVSGVVISRAVNAGEIIEANKELLRIASLSSVWVIAQIYEKDLAHAQIGSRVSVTANAYPDHIFHGRITYIDPSLNQATRTAQVRVEVEDAQQRLKLKMFVNVAFDSMNGLPAASARVPAAAVQSIGDQQVVFIATNNPHAFTLKAVRLGPEMNGFYSVIEGLTVGERIVTEGSFLLRAEWLKLHPNVSLLANP